MGSQSLPLLAYQAQNYKPFVDTGWVDIQPLALFFGHNSSGKTALLSVLPMLRQTLEDPNPEVPLVLSSETGIDLGVYEEVAHEHRVSLEAPVWFNFKIRYDGPPHRHFDVQSSASLLVRVAINYNKRRRRVAITEFRLSVLNPGQEEENQIFRLYRKTAAENQKWHVDAQEAIVRAWEAVPPVWLHLFPQVDVRLIGEDYGLGDILHYIYARMQDVLKNVIHLGPSRAFPRRVYRITGESPRDVGITGGDWLHVLLKADEQRALLTQVNRWLQRLGYELSLEWGKRGYVHPMLVDRHDVEVSLKDVGFGISQVLPILVQGFISDPGTILILEQPEIHLHPQAQADLGDMLLAIARRGVHLLVETHSEHLLLRIQRRLAEAAVLGEGSLTPEQVGVYYIEKIGRESVVHRIQMDATGTFLRPPDRFTTFFSDDYTETVERAKILARLAEEKQHARGD